jgi:glycosyltransferase involved in cell wall biosynthesis
MELMLRVCHLISGDLWAGAEVMACHLLKRLQNSPDLALSVILFNEGHLAGELRRNGLRVHIINEDRNSILQISQNIRKFLSTDPPQILHSHRYKENLLAFFASKAFAGCRLITTQHGLPEIQTMRPSLSGKVKSKVNFFILKHYFHKVVAVSDDIQSFFLNNLCFSPNRIKVIHNGINIPAEVSSPSTRRPLLVGSSGRLFPVKDYPLMVSIARALKRNGDFSFVLAGEGPERKRVEQAIVACDVADQFHLKGHLDDMNSYYKELDLYLNTSIHEGIPMTILEAMARGLPVVAPAVGGIVEIVDDGVEGFLVHSRDPEDYAEKCLLLQDVGLRKQMGQAARKKVEKMFSAEYMTSQYYQLYRDLIEDKREG